MRQFKVVKDAPKDTVLPKRGTLLSAGYDFYAPHSIYIPAHQDSETVWLNVKAIMEADEWLEMRNRSGLYAKHNISLSCSGVIDADYADNEENDGNIGVRFRNNSDTDFVINKGERCCQGIFHKYYVTDDDYVVSKRNGGYGSTGMS